MKFSLLLFQLRGSKAPHVIEEGYYKIRNNIYQGLGFTHTSKYETKEQPINASLKTFRKIDENNPKKREKEF